MGRDALLFRIATYFCVAIATVAWVEVLARLSSTLGQILTEITSH